MSERMQKTILFGSLLMIVAVMVPFGVSKVIEKKEAFAQMDVGLMGRQPFGGRTQTEKRCTCSNGCSLLTLGGPKGGDFMWCPSTRMYQYYNHSPTAWQLGLAGQYMPCMVRVGYYCVQQGGGPLMQIDGTSQY